MFSSSIKLIGDIVALLFSSFGNGVGCLLVSFWVYIWVVCPIIGGPSSSRDTLRICLTTFIHSRKRLSNCTSSKLPLICNERIVFDLRKPFKATCSRVSSLNPMPLSCTCYSVREYLRKSANLFLKSCNVSAELPSSDIEFHDKSMWVSE